MANLHYSLLIIFSIVCMLACCGQGQLIPNFYDNSCPNLQSIVRSVMAQAVSNEARMGASILRLFFHDCFVLGCDASILLDDTPNFIGEKTALPNLNSVRGFEVIDAIKAQVEANCPGIVSCADILALAARDGVNLLGGPTWQVLLGRRDSTTASLSEANTDIPSPFFNLDDLEPKFTQKTLTLRDMTALSGAHTIGRARCGAFRSRIYNDTNIDPNFAAIRKQTCPLSGGGTNLAPLDIQTPDIFDNSYYGNLMNQQGLLHSDQALFSGGSQDAQVQLYRDQPALHRNDFIIGMINMGNINPLTQNDGEIRLNCRKIN